ncbi:Arc family DNA-binding protein, partial [Acinetobacter baumannii]
MAKDYSQVNFRMPSKLKELLEEKAKDNERSLTA